MTIDDIIDDILGHEGKVFTNDPLDRGGATKYGVTLRTLADYRKPDPTSAADVENLTETDARAIYRDLYIVRPGFANIQNMPLMALMVDTGVHCGTDRAARWLQAALDTPVDGLIGNLTMLKLSQASVTMVYSFVLAERARHYARIYKDVGQRRFAAGWTNRLAHFIERTPSA